MAIRFLDCTILLVLATTILVLGNLVSSTSAQAECSGDLTYILAECRNSVKKDGPKTPPSKPCCEVFKVVDLPCLCKTFTPFIERYISVEKVIYVAKTCGCKIPPPGTKCGSYTIPSSPPSSPLPRHG